MATRNAKQAERRAENDNSGDTIIEGGAELLQSEPTSPVVVNVHTNGNGKPSDDGAKLAAAPAAPAPDPKAVEAAKLAERERVNQINEFAAKYAGRIPDAAKLAAAAVKEDKTVEAFKLELAEAMLSERKPSVNIDVGGTPARDEMPRALSAAMRIGNGVHVATDERKLFDKHGGKPINSLHQLARACVQLEGKQLGWSSGLSELLSAAISTSSFPEALSDSFNKSLHGGYAMAPRTFLDIFGRKPVKDFKEYKDIKLSSFARPGDVSGGRELPYTKFTETKETYRLGTYGYIFTLTREMWINDDMGIFTTVPNKLGFKMGDEFDQLGYEFLTQNAGVGPTMVEDSAAMFLTTRATPNYATGAASALKQSGFSAALQLLYGMKHGDDFLSLMPDFILVPPALWDTAVRLVTSPALVAGTNLTSTELEANRNIYQNIARPFMSPRLSGATNGTTAWYLGANQKMNPSIAAVTLNGVETPIVEQVSLPPEILGLGWRCYLDMAWASLDWRTIIRNKGA